MDEEIITIEKIRRIWLIGECDECAESEDSKNLDE